MLLWWYDVVLEFWLLCLLQWIFLQVQLEFHGYLCRGGGGGMGPLGERSRGGSSVFFSELSCSLFNHHPRDPASMDFPLAVHNDLCFCVLNHGGLLNLS